MKFFIAALLPLLAVAQTPTETQLRQALAAKTGIVKLPAGVIEVSREIVLAPDSHDLEITGPQTTLHASDNFRGRGLLVITGGKNIRIHDVALDGNRDNVGRLASLPQPGGAMLSRVVANNGIVAENIDGLTINSVKASKIAGFTVLVNGAHNVKLHEIEVTESGGINPRRRNSGMGGIAIEEGTKDFEITGCLFGKLRGTAIYLRATRESASNTNGRIAENEFSLIAQNAIQAEHTNGLIIESNTARYIGFPADDADTDSGQVPAALLLTADVKRAAIHGNRVDDTAGRCMMLDGMGDSEVAGNECRTILFGGITLAGSGNTISANRLLEINRAKKADPATLHAGIYLADTAKNNSIGGNEITGFAMGKGCLSGPGLAANRILKNDCSDSAAAAWLQPATPRSPASGTAAYPGLQ